MDLPLRCAYLGRMGMGSAWEIHTALAGHVPTAGEISIYEMIYHAYGQVTYNASQG